MAGLISLSFSLERYSGLFGEYFDWAKRLLNAIVASMFFSAYYFRTRLLLSFSMGG